MALRIVSAISLMRPTQQQLGAASNALRPFERLSSGQRVSDRPADVAVLSALRRDTRLATAALTNASQGVSLVSVANQALNEISALLEKMHELADTSSSSTFLTVDERRQMQNEYTQIASQVNQIATTTNFNGFNPLSSISANVVFQVGMDIAYSSSFEVGATEADLEALGLQSTGAGDLKYTLTDQQAASSLTSLVAGALAEIESKRAAFAVTGDRLQVSIANLTSVREGIEAAQTGILDSNRTSAMAENSRSAIVKDATAAFLAQANQEPLSAVKLLQVGESDTSTSDEFQTGSAQPLAVLPQPLVQRDEELPRKR